MPLFHLGSRQQLSVERLAGGGGQLWVLAIDCCTVLPVVVYSVKMMYRCTDLTALLRLRSSALRRQFEGIRAPREDDGSLFYLPFVLVILRLSSRKKDSL
jgi:hypothetical protein